MITLMICLLILTMMLGIGFKITGALLSAIFWLCIKLPLTLIIWAIGLACCCTLLLIPVGIILFKAGVGIMMPCCA